MPPGKRHRDELAATTTTTTTTAAAAVAVRAATGTSRTSVLEGHEVGLVVHLLPARVV
jgi:hypothetical protein